jgi:branched-chain amino acid transport system substrate-binding protein
MIIVLFVACDKKTKISPSGKSVKLTVLASLSGKGEAYGMQGLEGFKAAKNMMPLLPNGDEIVFEVVDDASDIQKAKEAIELIDTNISALITFSNSNIQLGITDVTEKKKLPTLSSIATHDSFTKNSSYMSRLSMSNSIEAEVAASYIRDELLINRVGVIYRKNNIFSVSLAESFKKEFESISGDIAKMISISELADIKEPYQIVMDRLDLDLIFFTTDAEFSYNFLKVFDELDGSIRLFGSDGLLSDMKRHYPHKLHLLDGVLVIDHYADNMNKNTNYIKLQRYLKSKKIQMSSFAALGYESYLFIYNALKECPNYSRECINNNLRNSKPINALVSTMYTRDGDMQRPIYVNEIEDAKMLRRVKVY